MLVAFLISKQFHSKSRLLKAYLPIGHLVMENKDIYTKWDKYLESYKLSDGRHHRYPTHLLEVEKILYLLHN